MAFAIGVTSANCLFLDRSARFNSLVTRSLATVALLDSGFLLGNTTVSADVSDVGVETHGGSIIFLEWVLNLYLLLRESC